LQQHLQPVSPETIAACLELFREHMGPAASLGSCAACGVVVLAERDWERGGDIGRVPLTPLQTLGLLQLSPEQLQAHLHISPADRPLFSVLEIVNSSGAVTSAYSASAWEQELFDQMH